MVFVTFNHKGRFGNHLFQYLTSKIFTIEHGHEYIPENEFILRNYNKDDIIEVNEDNIEHHIKNKDSVNKHICCNDYFQKSYLFTNYRNKLREIIFDENNNDRFDDKCIRDYIVGTHSFSLNDNDVVVSLRLDDFIHNPGDKSEILPPQYNIDILENMKLKDEKVYIVCDKINYEWEFKYIEFFKKWNPILVQNTLIHDIALMRDCKRLIHSNSTLCWIISFLSNKNERHIPITYFNKNQFLYKIDESDKLYDIQPLDHDEVHDLNINDNKIVPLAFSIPDECIVDKIPDKDMLLANLIPGDLSTYTFGKDDQEKYYQMYQRARFAITKIKGGWDCLRHYEILMNGCIPLFENLKDCPDYTMTTYPKHLNDEAFLLYNNWSNSNNDIEKYNILCEKFLDHTRKFCTSSYAANIILNNIKNGNKVKNVLLITGNEGFNYCREFTWIGLKRYIQSIGGVAVEYPKLDFVYDDYVDSSNSCKFTYSKRLTNDYNMAEHEIIDKIKSQFWDLIIYGKVGPDEYCNFPLYNIVKTKYNKNKIAFIYGGDEIFNLKVKDKKAYHINYFNVPIPYHRYNDYLNYYRQFGTCFVRELEM